MFVAVVTRVSNLLTREKTSYRIIVGMTYVFATFPILYSIPAEEKSKIQ